MATDLSEIVSEAVLEEAKKKLKAKTKAWTSGLCSGDCYTFTDKLGDTIYGSHTACHAWVTYAYGLYCFPGERSYVPDWSVPYKKGAKNFLTLTCHSRRRAVCDPSSCDFIILWMARHSPFSRFILNRDDEDSLLNDGAILLCGPDGLTLSQAMWVCKVLRYPVEGGKAADTFKLLVEGGVDGMLAVYVSSLIRTVKGATFGYTGGLGHMSVVDDSGIGLLGMVTRNLNEKAESTMTVFSKPRDVKVSPFANCNTKVINFCKPVLKSDGWGGSIRGEGVTGPDLVKQVLAWQEEFSHLIPDNGNPPVLPEPRLPLPTKSTVFLDLDL